MPLDNTTKHSASDLRVPPAMMTSSIPTNRETSPKRRRYFRPSVYLACSYILWLIVSISIAHRYFDSMQTHETTVAFQALFNNLRGSNAPQKMTTTMTPAEEADVVQDKSFLAELLREAGTLESDIPTNLNLFQGREPLLDLLLEAGLEELLDLPTILSLPKWSSVTKLYGENPVVIGLDTCEQFRKSVPNDMAIVAPAGLFNTATNTLADYIVANMEFPNNVEDSRGGTRWQVPWGKHQPVSAKYTNTATKEKRINRNNVMPIVIVRDPYSWMQSMCKNQYSAKWNHTDEHCPNLVVNEEDIENISEDIIEGMPVPVRVKYDPPIVYDSLAHYWSKWVREYYEADFPRLIVRFEDLQFHPKEMLEMIRTCVGAVPKKKHDGKFQYVTQSGKTEERGHKPSQTNLISAMIKYGTDKKRFLSLTKADLEFAKEAVDSELMQLLQYEMPP